MKSTILLCTTLLFLSVTALAQQPKSFNDLFEEMERSMQRGIPQQRMDTIRLKPGQNQYFQISPDSSSYFYFKMDTTLNGTSMQQFFRFGDSLNDPFGGSDPFGGGGFGNFNDIFRQMEEMQRQFFGFPPSTTPPAAPQEDDGLLPEERIRLKEEQAMPGTGDKPAAPAPPAKPAKPKIKTSRI